MKIDKNIRTLIWDLDGTLIDSFEIYAEVLAEAVRLNSLVMPEKSVLKHHFHGSLEDSIKLALELSDEVVFERLLKNFLEVQENYYALPDEHLCEDALELVKRAHNAGLQQIVVTNRSHEGRGNASPRHIVEHSQLASMIEYVVCGDEVTHRKPDARVLDGVPAKIDVTNCVVIGDQFVDAELAHNLQAHAILIDRNGEGIAHIDTLPDVANFLVVSTLDGIRV